MVWDTAGDSLFPFCQQYWWVHLLIHAWMFMCASFHLSSSLSHFYRLCGIDWFFTLSRDWEGRERRCWASVHYYFSQSVWHEWSLRSCDHKPADLSWNKNRRAKPIKRITLKESQQWSVTSFPTQFWWNPWLWVRVHKCRPIIHTTSQPVVLPRPNHNSFDS